ncbi:MAG: serine/threonine-protein kinase [Proteobacteria bacterium]|nr:serine/threonine-protein kinase [Pseudomonadota bacterium]
MPAQANQPLREGHVLAEYRILRVLAFGGFSFVYLAHDANDAPMAIKEYLPAGLALRTGDSDSPVVAEEDRGMFRYGLKCFFEEGRALAGLVHPNVVRVLNFFRANDTVYMVMRYERGRTLHEHIQARSGVLREAWLRETFDALMNGLREVHSNKLLHLDIKPGNVYVRNDGTPLLIDFGAARQMMTTGGTRLPPMYTPGFASPEHYANRENLGPWSDIYSVGATLYSCIAGIAPQPADARVTGDKVEPAQRRFKGKFSPMLLELIDSCLEIDPNARPQSVFALQKVLRTDPGPAAGAGGSVFDQLKGALSRISGRRAESSGA